MRHPALAEDMLRHAGNATLCELQLGTRHTEPFGSGIRISLDLSDIHMKAHAIKSRGSHCDEEGTRRCVRRVAAAAGPFLPQEDG